MYKSKEKAKFQESEIHRLIDCYEHLDTGSASLEAWRSSS